MTVYKRSRSRQFLVMVIIYFIPTIFCCMAQNLRVLQISPL